jgi:hypothetical protein
MLCRGTGSRGEAFFKKQAAALWEAAALKLQSGLGAGGRQLELNPSGCPSLRDDVRQASHMTSTLFGTEMMPLIPV